LPVHVGVLLGFGAWGIVGSPGETVYAREVLSWPAGDGRQGALG